MRAADLALSASSAESAGPVPVRGSRPPTPASLYDLRYLAVTACTVDFDPAAALARRGLGGYPANPALVELVIAGESPAVARGAGPRSRAGRARGGLDSCGVLNRIGNRIWSPFSHIPGEMLQVTIAAVRT